MAKNTTLVDFVARGASEGEWKMVLVEEGPWPGPIDDHLRRLQARLYGCIDAALDGQLAEKYPESKGCFLVIQLDCYNVPRAEVEDFFNRFSSGVFSTEDYRQALSVSSFVQSVKFEICFDHIH